MHRIEHIVSPKEFFVKAMIVETSVLSLGERSPAHSGKLNPYQAVNPQNLERIKCTRTSGSVEVVIVPTIPTKTFTDTFDALNQVDK
jgi:hypothetical protein